MTGSHLPRARPFHRSPDPRSAAPRGGGHHDAGERWAEPSPPGTGRGYSAPAFSASSIGICATLLADIHLVAW